MRRIPAITASGMLALALAACQGSFEEPRYDNPRDPANERLPAAPSADAEPCVAMGCGSACVCPPPKIEVTWTVADPAEVGGFQIYRAASETEDPGIVIASVGGAERCLVDGNLPGVPGLADGVTYWYRVRALSRAGIPGLRSAPAPAMADCP